MVVVAPKMLDFGRIVLIFIKDQKDRRTQNPNLAARVWPF
jgi:hypothetical protein